MHDKNGAILVRRGKTEGNYYTEGSYFPEGNYFTEGGYFLEGNYYTEGLTHKTLRTILFIGMVGLICGFVFDLNDGNVTTRMY